MISVGATPRILPTAVPDGERILTWTQLYDLPEIPEHLIVVGSGVTGAEFASAYRALGSKVTLISSRDQVLPGRGRRRGIRDREGLQAQRHEGHEQVAGGVGRARRRLGRRDPHRRARGARQPLPDGGRLRAEHGRHRPRGGRRAALGERAHPGQPRRPHVDAEHLRGRRLHDVPAARVGRVDAGPHRRVPRHGRHRRPARGAQHHLEHLHPARDRDGRLDPEGHRGGRRARGASTSCRSRRTRARR